VTNTLAYYTTELITAVNFFIVLAPIGPCVKTIVLCYAVFLGMYCNFFTIVISSE
jgi:hypothetical protein